MREHRTAESWSVYEIMNQLSMNAAWKEDCAVPKDQRPLATCNLLSGDVSGYTLHSTSSVKYSSSTWSSELEGCGSGLTMMIHKTLPFLCGDAGVGQSLKSPTDRLWTFHVLFLNMYHPVPSNENTWKQKTGWPISIFPSNKKQADRNIFWVQCLGRHQGTAWPKCALWRQSRHWSRVSSSGPWGITIVPPIEWQILKCLNGQHDDQWEFWVPYLPFLSFRCQFARLI